MKANMCRKLKCLTSAPARLSVAMPLIFGLATIAAAPTVEAVGIESVDIIDGGVDVNQNASVGALDDTFDVALWCNDHTPIRVDIIDGFVDVDEDGVVPEAADDLTDCDLNDETPGPVGPNNGVPFTLQVDICDGLVEVTQGPCPADVGDNATDIQLIQ